jgi:hypothetical protein
MWTVYYDKLYSGVVVELVRERYLWYRQDIQQGLITRPQHRYVPLSCSVYTWFIWLSLYVPKHFGVENLEYINKKSTTSFSIC